MPRTSPGDTRPSAARSPAWLFGAALVLACNPGDIAAPPPPPTDEPDDCGFFFCSDPDELIITPSPTLELGDTVQFGAVLRYENGETSEGPFAWSSQDSVLLPMSESGLAVGGVPGRADVEVVHLPDGERRWVRFAVLLGDAPVEPAVFTAVDGRCGLDLEGAIHCWGFGGAFLGLGYDAGARSTATPIVGGRVFRVVQAAASRACGLSMDGRTFCWGEQDLDSSPLGIGEADGFAPAEVLQSPDFVSLHVGVGELCGITGEGEAYCWGSTPAGTFSQPVLLAGGVQWSEIATGEGSHTCGLDTHGRAYCWGENNQGQLGDGTRVSREEPALVAADIRFADIAIVPSESCALDLEGQLYCWGHRGPGVDDRWLQPGVVDSVRYRQLSASAKTMCALREDGAPACWGQMHTAADPIFPTFCPTEFLFEPTLVEAEVPFASVSAGAYSGCGLTADGHAYCWGCGHGGQLGNGTFDHSPVPGRPVLRLP